MERGSSAELPLKYQITNSINATHGCLSSTCIFRTRERKQGWPEIETEGVVKKERMRIAKTAARIRSDVALLLALLALLFSAPRAVASQRRHPLDGLSADEYRAVVDILASGGLVTPDSRFHQISLEEPPKSYVKSFLLRDGADGDGVADGGLPIPRAAVAYVRSSPGRTHKAEVDLSSRTVLSWEASDPPAGQPMVLSEEFFGAGEIAKVDVRMVAGLAKRDLSPDDVYCVPFSAGTYGNPDEEGHRLLKVNCYAVPDRSDGNEKGNWWAMPIQGLFVVFDLNTNTALDVVDTGVVPVPSDPWGYTAAEVEERYGRRPVAVTREEGGGRSLPSSPSASSTPPADAGYAIDGLVVSWDFWRFHYHVDRRPGVILSLVEVNDGGTWRDVAYEVHLSEVFVPYMDPDVCQYYRTCELNQYSRPRFSHFSIIFAKNMGNRFRTTPPPPSRTQTWTAANTASGS